MAQIFSVNAVGYVKQTIAFGNLALIANPLNQPNNDLNVILPLKDDGTQDGVSIYRFANGSYRSTITWVSAGPGMGGVWFTPDGGNATVVNPGEGFFVYNNSQGGLAVDLTWVGEVMQGNLSNPIPANGSLSIRSSQVPQSAALGDSQAANAGSTLGFPATVNDLVYVFDVPTQAYLGTYTYIAPDPSLPCDPVANPCQWFSATDPNPLGPVIPVAGAFFVIKTDAAASVNWARTFSVN